MLKSRIVELSFLLLIATSLWSQNAPMVSIKRGAYVPLYGTTDKKPVEIAAFEMDVYPVTNAQFVTFLKKYPAYTRSKMKGVFADKSYLSHWQSDYDYGKNNLSTAPVTNVSWFAAKKYCECQGKRLPTMDEWEYVAMADEKRIDARTKEDFNKYIMSWYEKPKTYANPIGQTYKNYWGVYDMHGLVWEWTADFNSIFLSGESRKDKDTDKNLFLRKWLSKRIGFDELCCFHAICFQGEFESKVYHKKPWISMCR
jgi:formylglycine-generating enzyme required for sulfatase activity